MANKFKEFGTSAKTSFEETKKKVKRIITFIEVIVLLIMLAYSIYLICVNVDRKQYMIIYIILLGIFIISTLINFLYFKRNNDELDKQERKQKKHKKRIAKRVFKFFKIVCKIAIITIAIYEGSKYGMTTTMRFSTVGSAIAVGFQIAFEVISIIALFFMGLVSKSVTSSKERLVGAFKNRNRKEVQEVDYIDVEENK